MSHHVLIADPDPQTARLLAPALRHRGYQVSAVKTGSQALELCVLRAPDLVLFDVDCPLLDAQTFKQILRSNPHTAELPILVTGSSEGVAPMTLRDGFLLKPFNVDEVLSRVDQLFRRIDAARKSQKGDQGMEGTLGQLSLTDLLQILGQNRRSGRLELTSARGAARVRIAEGLVAEAEAEGAVGTKALFRLLLWKEGGFAFVPGALPEDGSAGRRAEAARPEQSRPESAIGKSVEELLLEGMRQADELPALRAALPSPQSRLVWTAGAARLEGEQHPVTAEMLEIVRAGATVAEAIDRARSTDHSAAQALLTLLKKGIVATATEPREVRRTQRPLIGSGELHALLARLQQGRTDGSRPIGKILLASPDKLRLRSFLERLAEIKECRLDPEGAAAATALAFGTAGQLAIADDLALDFVLLPTSEEGRPLWQPFAVRAIGGIVLLGGGEFGQAAADLVLYLARDRGLPVLLPDLGELPAPIAAAAPNAAPAPGGAEATLRELLTRASRPQLWPTF